MLLEAAADIFRRLGAEVVDIDVPFTVQDYRACVRLIGQAEALSIHEETFRTRHHLMGRALRDKVVGSISLSAAEFVRATRWRREIIERTDAAVRSCDAVLCGGSLHAVPLLNDEPATIAYMLDSPNCVFNVTGHPSAAVCAGLDARGLPMSIQIAARYFDEATVFRVAAAYEAATGSTKARAPLTAGTLPPPVRRAAAGVTVGAPGAEAAPSREAIAGILRRMKVERVGDAMIERAHALCVNATVMIARVPASVPNDRDPAHVLALPQGLP